MQPKLTKEKKETKHYTTLTEGITSPKLDATVKTSSFVLSKA